MKNKGLILLLLGAGAAYLLYQRSAKAGELSSKDQAAYLERLRQAAIRQQQVEAMRNQQAHTAVITDSGNIAPPPSPVFVARPMSSPESPMTGVRVPSTKYGPVMVP